MKYKNTRLQIITPLVIAVFFIIGVLIGKNYSSPEVRTAFLPSKNNNKLDVLLNVIDENYVDSISKDQIVEKAIPDILNELDPHSVYIPGEKVQRVREPLQGNFEGIGIEFNIKNDTVLVINTIPGGPSEKVGILPGDRIVTISDSVFAGPDLTTEDVIDNLKGTKGTTVDVGVKRPGENDLLHFTIKRDNIPINSIEAAYMVTDTSGYLKISRFAQTTHDEFLDSVKVLKNKGMKNIVLDLRSNSGGLLDAAINIADEFLADGKLIVYTKGRARRLQEYYASGEGLLEETDVVVLIDSWSASASEILAGAIQDNDRGTIVGQRSFGKGLVQEPVMFQDGSVLRLTIARYYTPTGRCIQKPYQDGKSEYYSDIHTRFENGELSARDSIHLPDSLKYTTPAGDTVYGGGGIMPDIFVPMDTSYSSDYLDKIRRKGLIYRFALNYSDNHRKKLEAFPHFHEALAYLKTQDILQQFTQFAAKKEIDKDPEGLSISGNAIETQITAYVLRNIFHENAFYSIIHRIDNTYKRGISLFEDNTEQLLSRK